MSRPWGSKKHWWSVNTARWGQLPVPLLAPPSPSSSFLSCQPQSTCCTFTEWAVPFQGDDPMGQVWSRTLTLDHQPGNTDVSKVSRPASPGRGSRALQRRGCGLPGAPVPMRPASRGLESCRATPSRCRDPPPAHPPQLLDLLGKSLSERAAEGPRPLQRRVPCPSPSVPWLALLADCQGSHVCSWPCGAGHVGP